MKIKDLKVSDNLPKGIMKLVTTVVIAGVITGGALGIVENPNPPQEGPKYFSEMTQEEKEEISSRVYLVMENNPNSEDPEFLYLTTDDGETISGIVDSRSDRDFINMQPGEYHIYSKKLQNTEDQPVINIDDVDRDYTITVDYETGEITVSTVKTK